MKQILCLFVLGCVLVLAPLGAAADSALPSVGGALPEFSLAVPEGKEFRHDLGLEPPGKGDFSVSQIDARIVIIEIFSMYCPYCQKEAPAVNRLYEAVEGDPALKGRVKLIGIGVGNSAFEVGFFRKTYNVPFPLFSDGDFAVHKKLGEPRTPFFIAVEIRDDRSTRIVHTHLGSLKGPEQYLETLLKLTEVK